ncbi:2-C-methyl-D-erythritol 4-phosphate cytidylyltransferase [Sodalis sp. CWE]|uniref:2-C-methyl-D-erythritol 4-phosphate cytidylyltransferase n=1 Tax=Sodalis sp. CWE TaxID=2803816 RepID=UPI001C7E1CA8|nr:2-C-methyl-D-erythritol 4-phosphate cytidylyltransferase [Sodalis sp. CWE]MBX4180987.1 2-C-methyl-D-erythritol 4-phosphate cytidylyltransferase [Sodalis sp. CWE]
MTNVIAVLPAAGVGSRMGSDIPKQYLTIGNKTLLEHAIERLFNHPYIHEVIVAINANDHWYYRLSISNDIRVRVVTGGLVRTHSVMAALRYTKTASWVLVHDASRPCLHQDDLFRLLKIVAYTNIGGVLAVPVRDTIKRAYAGSKNIFVTVDRKDLWHALTPQLFSRNLLVICLEKVISKNITITDEASALEYCGYSPLLVPGRADNIKVTYPEDLELARFFLS